jgi:lipoyl(octanoyl) transferase
MHGVALNVNTDLEPFSLINPGGFSDRKATSMAKLLGQDIPMAAVTERLLAHFPQVFDFCPRQLRRWSYLACCQQYRYDSL